MPFSHSHSNSSTSNSGAANAQQSGTGSTGGGLFGRLRGQAEAALAKVPGVDQWQHDLRQGYVAANPTQSKDTLKLQLAIKGLKGVIIDSDALSRETRSYSKNVLDLSRQEPAIPNYSTADIQDVGDRLAFLTYKTGELYTDYAKKLEQSRTYLKDVRNFEANLQPQRKQRNALEKEIEKVYTSGKDETTVNSKVQSLQTELNGLTGPDSALTQAEISALRLRRQKMVEAYNTQFDALQELGEKLAIIAGHGKVLLEGWDTSEQAGRSDYVDGARTANVRTGVESALSSWSANKAHIPRPVIQGNGNQDGLQRSVSFAPSFHDSHKSELASLHSEENPAAAHDAALESYYRQPESPGIPTVGSSTTGDVLAPVPIPGTSGSQSQDMYQQGASPSIAHQINTAPVTSLPGTGPSSAFGQVSSPPVATSSSSSGPGSLPHVPSSPTLGAQGSGALPTVAETGAPITGTGGPSSGVLRPPSTQHRSKEEEAREDTQRRFDEYSGGYGDGSAQDGNGLDRNASVRTQLPAYKEMGDQNPFADQQTRQ